jgi:hypothetical protein
MFKLRDFIDIVSESDLKKAAIDLVKQTDDESVLAKVVSMLKAGNIEVRVVKVIKGDADSSKFVKQIASVIVGMDFSVEEKDAFLKRFPSGIIDIKRLLSGKPSNLLELVGGDQFARELFKLLSVSLTSQGVGPGEVALSVFHPDIKWSGRAMGGGDIIVNGRAVEVKTSIAGGGRWINARKANMDLTGIQKLIVDASGIKQLPNRININFWVNTIIPEIVSRDPKNLDRVSTEIAKKLFGAVDSLRYASALASGVASVIIDEHLRTGFENYKKLSGFEGILMMDMRTEMVQYFKDYDSMRGKIRNDTVYIYAPKDEIMPKVSLLPVEGISMSEPVVQREPAAPKQSIDRKLRSGDEIPRAQEPDQGIRKKR